MFKYHIVPPDVDYLSCSCHTRRKTYCDRQYIVALCGERTYRGEDSSCSLSIAHHVIENSKRNWCSACLNVAPWTDEYRGRLIATGFLRDHEVGDLL